MRRLTKGLLITGMLSFSAMAVGGCADNNTMLFVQGVMAVTGDCTVRADPGSLMLLTGVMDTYFRSEYRAALLVGNQLVSRGSRDQLRTESNRVVLKGAEVKVLDSQERLLSEFTVPGTGFADVGTGTDPGYGVLSTILIPSSFPAVPGQLYLVDVRVFGDTLGDTQVESATLRFPITTCDRCLLSFPLEADDPAVSGYQCTSSDKPPESTPCRIGQDEAIDCRLCAASDPNCQTP
jgi:hypothetical protein